MKRILVIIALLAIANGAAFAACTGSSPTWTSTPDYASVSSCFSSSSRGDTINVSAGSSTWLNQLTITHGIIIHGAGIASTTIRDGFNGINPVFKIQPDATAIANSENVSITGILFDGMFTLSQVTTNGTAVTWSSGDTFVTGSAWVGIQYYLNGVVYTVASVTDSTHMTLTGSAGVQASPVVGSSGAQELLQVTGAGDSGTKPWRYLIIAGNKFQNVVAGDTVILINNQVRGVIAGNTFDRQGVLLRTFGADTTTEWANTAYNNFNYGSSDNLYFEGNTVLWSSPYTLATDPGWIESGQGARIVPRFNTVNFTNSGQATSSEMYDVHGFQNFPGSGQTGTMITEYYNNALTNGISTNRWINHRGSWGMFFGNTYGSVSGTARPSIEANQYAGCPAYITPAPAGYNPVINNTYVFNNTEDGTRKDMNIASSDAGCTISLNVNIWNQQSVFDGTVGVGVGVLASRPATCTTGVGYWATDQGAWNSSGSGGQGLFYKCTAPNTWALYYTPYPYPHPLLWSAVGGMSFSGMTFSIGVR